MFDAIFLADPAATQNSLLTLVERIGRAPVLALASIAAALAVSTSRIGNRSNIHGRPLHAVFKLEGDGTLPARTQMVASR